MKSVSRVHHLRDLIEANIASYRIAFVTNITTIDANTCCTSAMLALLKSGYFMVQGVRQQQHPTPTVAHKYKSDGWQVHFPNCCASFGYQACHLPPLYSRNQSPQTYQIF